ncbi:hypothetical protein NHQ30_011277 [Ciborinia camelliae]|nr:hypothetical protein NHQ30_011277 [Ciborinia camelliae]
MWEAYALKLLGAPAFDAPAPPNIGVCPPAGFGALKGLAAAALFGFVDSAETMSIHAKREIHTVTAAASAELKIDDGNKGLDGESKHASNTYEGLQFTGQA